MPLLKKVDYYFLGEPVTLRFNITLKNNIPVYWVNAAKVLLSKDESSGDFKELETRVRNHIQEMNEAQTHWEFKIHYRAVMTGSLFHNPALLKEDTDVFLANFTKGAIIQNFNFHSGGIGSALGINYYVIGTKYVSGKVFDSALFKPVEDKVEHASSYTRYHENTDYLDSNYVTLSDQDFVRDSKYFSFTSGSHVTIPFDIKSFRSLQALDLAFTKLAKAIIDILDPENGVLQLGGINLLNEPTDQAGNANIEIEANE